MLRQLNVTDYKFYEYELRCAEKPFPCVSFYCYFRKAKILKQNESKFAQKHCLISNAYYYKTCFAYKLCLERIFNFSFRDNAIKGLRQSWPYSHFLCSIFLVSQTLIVPLQKINCDRQTSDLTVNCFPPKQKTVFLFFNCRNRLYLWLILSNTTWQE